MEGFTERLKKLVKESNYSQKEISQMIGVTEAALSQYINGLREPKIEVVRNIATLFNTTSDYLLNGDMAEKADFETVYRFVTRSASEFTDEEKLKLIKLLTK